MAGDVDGRTAVISGKNLPDRDLGTLPRPLVASAPMSVTDDYLANNAEYAKTWPNITIKRDPPADAKDWEGKPDKIKLFDPEPGEGD